MIPGLDGLRAIAFLLVFALHTDYLQIGWVGVQLFLFYPVFFNYRYFAGDEKIPADPQIFY
jgi:peptidoglycan/LPS O-acetylase OafA/YrhL